jgi:multicomponent Na+:H+ antiporter subunit F
MILVLLLGGVMLTAAAALLLVRIARGPTMLDRIAALDVLVAVLISGLAIEAAAHHHTTTLPILVVLALVGFVGSVTVARFAEVSPQIEQAEEGRDHR